MNRASIRELVSRSAQMVRANHQPLPYHLSFFNQANAFHLAGLRCSIPEVLDNNKVQIASFPAIVCYAFASEVYLKTILTASGKAIHGHHLGKLLSTLDSAIFDKIQIIYRSQVQDDNALIKEEVARFASAFIDWRYIYEKQNLEVHVSDVIAFARSLFLYIRMTYPDWPIDTDLLAKLHSPPPENITSMIWIGNGLTIRGRFVSSKPVNVNVQMNFSSPSEK